MPTLNWIGKEAVATHHERVPFRLIKHVPDFSAGPAGEGNLLVQGDNLLALKALLPYYAAQVKCVYIDPPYNTGVDDRDDEARRTGWIYNDNVNDPIIREWLGRVVGPEAEDLSRHDKWLCMMYPRLVLLRRMLRSDGVLFASIDDIEVGYLRLLLDEVFGRSNFVGTIVWKNATDNNPTNIVAEHEYVICYAKQKSALQPAWKSSTLAVKETILEVGRRFVGEFEDQEDRQAAYTKWFRGHRAELWPFQDYKFIDDGGIYTGMRSVHNPGKEGYRYDVIHPQTKKPCQQPLMGYRFPLETMNDLIAGGRILFGEDETKLIELKVYASDYRSKLSSLFELDGRVGTNELKALFPESKRTFDFPKPTGLIEELLSFTTTGEDIVLDSFAGSGTTGHAVMSLNRADGQARRFVLIEMKPLIARSITAERLKRVQARSKGLGAGFRFCELGEPLFDDQGKIRDSVSFSDLARHVYFTETGEPLPSGGGIKSPFLGSSRGVGIYLLYNGILGDKSPGGGNVLTRKVLASLPMFNGTKVIYCAGCLLGQERLAADGVVVRQTPYEIKIS